MVKERPWRYPTAPKKKPVSCLTDWHYPQGADFFLPAVYATVLIDGKRVGTQMGIVHFLQLEVSDVDGAGLLFRDKTIARGNLSSADAGPLRKEAEEVVGGPPRFNDLSALSSLEITIKGTWKFCWYLSSCARYCTSFPRSLKARP